MTHQPITVALAKAIHKLLDRQQASSGIDLGGYWSGIMNGYYGLFAELNEDRDYYNLVDRPHDAATLRKLLKKLAQDLHRDHGIIISLERKRCDIEKVK